MGEVGRFSVLPAIAASFSANQMFFNECLLQCVRVHFACRQYNQAGYKDKLEKYSQKPKSIQPSGRKMLL